MPAIILTENDDGKTLRVRRGAEILVKLPENPTTGFKWNLRKLNGDCLSLESDAYIPNEGSGVGGGGTRQFLFLAKSYGSVAINLKNMREWEGEKSAQSEFTLSMIIE